MSTKSVAVGLVEDGDFQETWSRRRRRREQAMCLERPRYQGSGDIDDGEVIIGILCKAGLLPNIFLFDVIKPIHFTPVYALQLSLDSGKMACALSRCMSIFETNL